MVLEERIAVSSEDEAKEIVRYLKKENIPARIFTEPRMNVALILAGQHEDLRSFLTACQEKHLERGVSRDDGEENPVDFDPSVWKDTLVTLDSERMAITRILDEHKPGDLIGTNVYQTIFQNTRPDVECSTEEFARELATVRTLISNRLCEITQQGFVLTHAAEPGDVTLYIPYDYPFPPEEEVSDRFHITCIRHFRGEISYVVQTGPEILFLDDVEAFVMFLSDNGVDPRSLLSLTERCMSRLRITQELISQLFEAEQSSLDDIRLLFADEIATKDGQGHVQDRFGLSPFYVDSLVADLRKLGMVKGKDTKLRPGNPSGNTPKSGRKKGK